ncbi:4-aminobutyrate--2-oxoglutarate transaminase [Flexivirga endophytica]|nr:4-aminobutyrate--2-oxoglutarate transaminase [Flexivirga endophytica]
MKTTALPPATPVTSGLPDQQRKLVTPIPGPRSRVLHEQRAAALPPGLSNVVPVFVERAGGGIIVDVDGNHLVDLASGIAVTSVGASAPEVVTRVQEQVAKFTHTCFLVTEYQGYVDVATWLNEHAPVPGEATTALFSTGAEAVENAVKIARAATSRPAVIVFDNAYHGRSLFTLAMTAKDRPYKDGFGPFDAHVHRAPYAQQLRWPGDPAQATPDALAELQSLLNRVGPETVAAIVIEPVQGEGGFIVPAPGFLRGVQSIARQHGIVLVADEVQAGIARTGRLFASEHDGLEPDLVVTAKALGGGLPLAAVTGRADIMAAARVGGLGGTYAGNPVACAAALGVFEIIERDGLVERAAAIEQHVIAALQPVIEASGVVAELRGHGAMMAIELVRPGTLEPDPEAAVRIARACHKRGVLLLVCGTFGNVIRLLPPLVIDGALLDDGLQVLADAIWDET